MSLPWPSYSVHRGGGNGPTEISPHIPAPKLNQVCQNFQKYKSVHSKSSFVPLFIELSSIIDFDFFDNKAALTAEDS